MTVPDAPPSAAASAQAATPRRGTRLWHVVAGFAVVFAGGSALLWFLRKPVAEQALAAWCAERDLQCDAEFTRLDTTGMTLSGLKVTSGNATPAEAGGVRADIRWTGLFTPKVTGVTVDGLTLQGTLDAGGLRFGGLERLAASGGGGGPAPPIEIADARVLIETPLGPANATLNMSGVLTETGQLSMRFDPGELANTVARADLREARLDVRARSGVIEAEARLQLAEAGLGANGLDGAELIARAGFDEGIDGPAGFEWSVRATRLTSPDLRASDLRTSGSASFGKRDGAAAADFIRALTGAAFNADAASLVAAGYTVRDASLKGELDREAGRISGPLRLTAGGIDGAAGRAGNISAAGEIVQLASGEMIFDGGISVIDASISPDQRAAALAVLDLPGVLSGHGTALRAALDRGLSDFAATSGVRVATKDRVWSVSATSDAQIDARSGLTARIGEAGDTPWLTAAPGSVLARGRIDIAGGGAPVLSLSEGQLAWSPEGIAVESGALRLADWFVGGRKLSADLRQLRYTDRGEALLFSASGTLGFAGNAGSVDLKPTRISGGLDGARDAAGWRVQSAGGDCLLVDTAGLKAGAIDLAPTRLNVCPVNGRFMRQGKVPGGAADLGAVRLPFALESGTGELVLDKARLDWTAGQGLALSISADSLQLPLTLGDRTLTVDAEKPRIDLGKAGRPAGLAARLGQTRFGGDVIPARASAREFVFDGVNSQSGISGDVAIKGVLVSDTQRDPLYAPLIADFTGTMGNNRLALAGPVALRASGIPIADLTLDLDVVRLDGKAALVSRRLDFRKGGLQPNMISGRLTGLFTDATGGISSDARFRIRDGRIDGTADVDVRAFGFQTTRLGRVTGINGQIAFSDLMRLETGPNQEITIGSINPGIPLSDGRIVFDLRGSDLHLETVTFPFSGGRLSLAPFDWPLSGNLVGKTVQVNAETISLERLVNILKLPDTKASGVASGTFPLVFTEKSVRVDKARLRAAAPGGALSYTGGAVGAAAGQDQNAGLAFEALRDFRFTVLEIGLDGDLAGKMRADLVLAGQNLQPLPMGNGRRVPAGQPFEFAIGFDLPLASVIGDSLSTLSQQEIIDRARDLLEKEARRENPPRRPE